MTPSWPIGVGIVTLAGMACGGLRYETIAPGLGKSFRLRMLRGTASVLLIWPVSV